VGSPRLRHRCAQSATSHTWSRTRRACWRCEPWQIRIYCGPDWRQHARSSWSAPFYRPRSGFGRDSPGCRLSILSKSLVTRWAGVVSAPTSRFFTEAYIRWGASISLGVGSPGSSAPMVGSPGSKRQRPALARRSRSRVHRRHPNSELARDAGLAADNGIVVDRYLATDDPAISAIGDCANFPTPFASGRVRLESVQNAVDQARCVAARIAGRPEPYERVPWFWSDQGDLKLQIAGITAGHDQSVIRGDPASGHFSVFCFSGDRLIGVESVNRPADHAVARRLLAGEPRLSPQQAADGSSRFTSPRAECSAR